METVALPIELYPCNMGRSVGIEPTRAGATIQCVNHFTTTAIYPSRQIHSACLPFFNRQLPILPGRLQPSTFGVYVLNYCVRYGYRWVHIAIITGSPRIYPGNYTETYFRHLFSKLSPRPISTGPLRPLPDFHSQPIYLVVFKGSYQIAL